MYCDYETPSVYDEKRVRARKPHVCCETGRTIAVGEYYWRCEMLFDGQWSRYVQCEAAYRFARKVNGVEPYDPNRYDPCIPFGGIAEYIEEIQWPTDPFRLEWERIMSGE